MATVAAGSSAADRASPLLVRFERSEPPNVSQLKEQLETGTEEVKIDALKRAICFILNGENLTQLLMPIIRYVMPLRNKLIKKLLLIFLEIIDKTSPDGKLLPEMILVCNAIRNDLIHPNEYVRGCALRFLCRIKDAELIDPLLPTVRSNLEHRHSYVRRSAVLAIWSIYKHHESLIPDAVQLLHEFLTKETDTSCRRNTFAFLTSLAPEAAAQYLQTLGDQLSSQPDAIQLVALELIRRLGRANPAEKSKYVRTVIPLLTASAASVQFDAAQCLILLSHAPVAVRAAANSYITLLCTHSDNNVKLIVLDRLVQLKEKHTRVLQDLVMDLLRALATPSLDIRKKTLSVVLELVTPRSIEEVITMLRKEITKTQSAAPSSASATNVSASANGVASARDEDVAGQYRRELLHAIRSCATRFPEVASNVVLTLVEFLGDTNAHAASEAAAFVRETIELNAKLRAEILGKLCSTLPQIHAARVFRTVLWILGEYSVDAADIDQSFTAIRDSIGDVPLMPTTNSDAAAAADEKKEKDTAAVKKQDGVPAVSKPAAARKPQLLPDGSYASQTVYSELAMQAATRDTVSTSAGTTRSLRTLLLQGDYFLGCALASCLTKLVLKARRIATLAAAVKNQLTAQVLLMLVSLLRYGGSPQAPQAIDTDSHERLLLCVRTLLLTDEQGAVAKLLLPVFLSQAHQAFVDMLQEQKQLEQQARADAKSGKSHQQHQQQQHQQQQHQHQKQKDDAAAAAAAQLKAQCDDLIRIRQLKPGVASWEDDDEDLLPGALSGGTAVTNDDVTAVELARATGQLEKQSGGTDGTGQTLDSALERVHQLTGFSDPLYAEAKITVHQYDIMLELQVMNQTGDTLQNVALELATLGDLRLLERPQTYTLGPYDRRLIRANIKVSSTENGVVFGNLVYDLANQTAQDKNCVILSDIHIDIMDYLVPAHCSEHEFRTMWAEFEWENKVTVSTTFTEPLPYLAHVMRCTNMANLTPAAHMPSASDTGHVFLSANLYARSVFGEDVLANVSLERQADGKLQGSMRIRSKTQGIALSIGDKVNQKQKVVGGK